MSLLSRTELEPPIFNLLSLGQRGVGKTVFLAGSYAELRQPTGKDASPAWWFECQDSQDQENLEKILNYAARTGEYPPPTMKITDFCLTLKQRDRWGTKSLCRFRWWDIPGEYCNFQQPEFQQMVLDSHSCCVFIDAEKLVNDPHYPQQLAGLVGQIAAIGNLVAQEALPYAFALIFTQCDRLGSVRIGRLQIEEKLQFLTSALAATGAKYRRFYSAIPLVSEQGNFTFQPFGAAESFLWLASELEKNQKQLPEKSLGEALQSTPAESLLRNSRRPVWVWAGAMVGLLGVAVVGWLAIRQLIPAPQQAQTPVQQSQTSPEQIQSYQTRLKENPNDFEALVALGNLYLEQGQLETALPIMEKIAQQKPDAIDWQLNLAKLYELTNNLQKSEATYDRILARDPKQVQALVGKATLRSQQGDLKGAATLFQQAEQVASSSDLKAKIREWAGQSLK